MDFNSGIINKKIRGEDLILLSLKNIDMEETTAIKFDGSYFDMTYYYERASFRGDYFSPPDDDKFELYHIKPAGTDTDLIDMLRDDIIKTMTDILLQQL